MLEYGSDVTAQRRPRRSWRLSADDSHAQKGDSQALGSEPALTVSGHETDQ